jgi:hypothetical protein
MLFFTITILYLVTPDPPRMQVYSVANTVYYSVTPDIPTMLAYSVTSSILW